MRTRHLLLYSLRLAFVIVLIAGVFLPKPVLAAPTWTSVAPLDTARFSNTATLLLNGNVLVVGGYNAEALSSVELFDPSADTWTSVRSLNAARGYHTATLFPSGQVLVAGGYNGSNSLASAELLYANHQLFLPFIHR